MSIQKISIIIIFLGTIGGMFLPQLVFSQAVIQEYDFQIPLRSTPYRLNLHVSATSMPEANRHIRRPKLMNKLFRPTFSAKYPTVVQHLSIEKTDRISLSLQHRKKPKKLYQLTGELHINYYLSGFSAPRLFTYQIDSLSNISLDYHTIQQQIEVKNQHIWDGKSMQASITNLVWEAEAGSTEVKYFPHISIRYKP